MSLQIRLSQHAQADAGPARAFKSSYWRAAVLACAVSCALPAIASAAAGPGGFSSKPAGIDAGSWATLKLAATDAFAATPSATLAGNPSGAAYDGSAGDHFGYSVAVSGNTALIGVPIDTTAASTAAGSVYVFTRSGTSWTVQTKLSVALNANSQFGASVALQGDTALIGAPGMTVTTPVSQHVVQGAAYVFTRVGTTWSQQAQLLTSDGQALDRAGISVALSNDTAVVGAAEGSSGNDGAAYVFTRAGTTWTQQAKLGDPAATAADAFGGSVAIDTDTLVVGAAGTAGAGGNGQGTAYVFTRAASTWSLQSQLTATDGAASDAFGTAVAVSGNTAMAGAPNGDSGATADQGAAYVFLRAGTSWSQQAKLVASDAAASAHFGISLAVQNNDALVGAAGAGANGAVYAFTRSGTAWSQQARLVAADAQSGDLFGAAVAYDTGSLLSGAYQHAVGGRAAQGAAYVHTRTGSSWTQQAELAQAGVSPPADGIGESVSIDGNYAVVSSSTANGGIGVAYVFVCNAGVWTRQAVLQASDPHAGDLFGAVAVISGDTVAISASAADLSTATLNQGAVYIYVRNGTTWTQQAKVSAVEAIANDYLGNSLALRGDTLLVGDQFANTSTANKIGAAYVFVRSAGTWTEQARLIASDRADADAFGSGVALDGNTAIVGAHWDDNPGLVNSGSAYVFVRSGTTWTQQAKLLPSDPSVSDEFGFAVALSGDTAIIGAPNKASNAGAAYAFTRTGTSWSQQAKITPTAAATNARFGSYVALENDIAPIGTSAAATVFTRSGTTWTQSLVLGNPGGPVAISGANILTGNSSANAGYPYGNGHEGAGYVYTDPSALAATTTGLTSSVNPVTQGQSVTFTATVSGVAPTGAVNFSDAGTSIAGCASRPLTGSGDTLTATCTTTALTTGTHPLTAVYSGDAANRTSLSTVLSQVVTASTAVATQTVLTSSANPKTVGQTLVLTATVSGNAPTGPVAFLDAGTPLTNCTAQALTITAGTATATCSVATLTAGTHSLTATYAGDGFNQPSTSAALQQRINALPVITAASTLVVIEDQSNSISISVSDDSTPVAALTVTASSSNQSLVTNASLNAGFTGTGSTRTLTVTPIVGQFGSATITLNVTDSDGGVGQTTFFLQVAAVNHQPNFTLAAPPVSSPGTTGLQNVDNFVTSVTFGVEDGGQSVISAYHLTLVSDPSGIITGTTKISVDNIGTLSYTLTGASGTATYSVTLQDAYGTANGGVDTSVPHTFTISVGPKVDLQVTVSNGQTYVYPNESVLYEIMVANAGVNTATGASFSNTLPASLTGVTWKCTAIQLATCPVASGSGNIAQTLTLPAGSALRFDVLADIPATASGTLTDTAAITVPAGSFDSDLSSNTASDSDAVKTDGIFRDGFDTPTQLLSVPIPAGTSIYH